MDRTSSQVQQSLFGLLIPPPACPAEPAPNDTARRLERVVDELSDAINSGSRSQMQRVVEEHFSPTLCVRVTEPFSAVFNAMSRQAFVDNFMAYLASLPDFHNRWEHATAQVDEQRGRAQVFQTYATSGSPGAGLVRENVVVYDFERRAMHGSVRWMGTQIRVVQGPGHYTFDIT